MTNVLVVDAERVMRSTLKERLEYEGYVVDTAQSRSEAMGKLERTIFDVILCDMSLPDKEAFDLLTTVHSAYLGLPVIMLSKNKGLDAAVDCMRRGAYDYIEKPIDLNKLFNNETKIVPYRFHRCENRAVILFPVILRRKIALPQLVAKGVWLLKLLMSLVIVLRCQQRIRLLLFPIVWWQDSMCMCNMIAWSDLPKGCSE